MQSYNNTFTPKNTTVFKLIVLENFKVIDYNFINLNNSNTTYIIYIDPNKWNNVFANRFIIDSNDKNFKKEFQSISYYHMDNYDKLNSKYSIRLFNSKEYQFQSSTQLAIKVSTGLLKVIIQCVNYQIIISKSIFKVFPLKI